MSEPQYIFQASDPGVFVEVYLPKKAAFQGTLYTALTEGFDRKNVKEYIRNNDRTIEKLLEENYPEIASFARNPSVLDNFPGGLFTGYSMYEVDGVFFDPKLGLPIEERVQVIRLMFRFYADTLTAKLREELTQHQLTYLPDRYLRRPGRLEVLTRNDLETNGPSHRAEEKRVMQFLCTLYPGASKWNRDKKKVAKDALRMAVRWEDYVALFVFGYVVHEICKKILEMNTNHAKKEAELKLDKESQKGSPEEWQARELGLAIARTQFLQQVIWVTSLWNLRVNRVEFP